MRKWHKGIPPKYAHKHLGMYTGEWMPWMDKYWESDDGYDVMARQIRTEWGKVTHITIHRLGGAGVGGDIPWAVKQQIKNELFGEDRTAIEVFPTRKNLVDICDVYHLWLLPKEMKLPFGIHPTRDPKGVPVECGFDFNLEEFQKWVESPERKALMEGGNGIFGD